MYIYIYIYIYICLCIYIYIYNRGSPGPRGEPLRPEAGLPEGPLVPRRRQQRHHDYCYVYDLLLLLSSLTIMFIAIYCYYDY